MRLGFERPTSMAAGVGAKALLSEVVPAWLAGVTGSVLILFSAFCLVAAVWREATNGVLPPHPGLRRLPSLFQLSPTGF